MERKVLDGGRFRLTVVEPKGVGLIEEFIANPKAGAEKKAD